MISLITVVHNEKDRLWDFFHPVKDYVTDIIVVDDGSTDQTASIAIQFANVYLRFKQCSGYCERRLEQALNFSTSDWVLRLDADEIIPEKHLVEICESIYVGELDEYDSVQFNRKNCIDGKLVREELKVRLVKRDVLRYSEKLHTEEEGYTNTYDSDWIIVHDKTKEEVISDFKRYIEELKKNPNKDVDELVRGRAKEYGVYEELYG